MIQIKAAAISLLHFYPMQWEPVATTPSDCELELAVIDRDGPHALAFACRRVVGGWINAKTKQTIDVRPTHWREWNAKS